MIANRDYDRTAQQAAVQAYGPEAIMRALNRLVNK